MVVMVMSPTTRSDWFTKSCTTMVHLLNLILLVILVYVNSLIFMLKQDVLFTV